jgi:hypothetical protein
MSCKQKCILRRTILRHGITGTGIWSENRHATARGTGVTGNSKNSIGVHGMCTDTAGAIIDYHVEKLIYYLVGNK